jgi:signal peptidase I
MEQEKNEIEIEESSEISERSVDELLAYAETMLNKDFEQEYEPEQVQSKTWRERIYNFVHSFCVPILIGLLASLILTQVVFFHAEVPSGSMETTIMTGDRLVGSRVYLWFAQPKRGDIMIFWSDEYGEFIVKRVIGCPGDEVEIRDNGVYVNGELLAEDYTQGITVSGKTNETIWRVPKNSYFMMGDNRENSADSRYWLSPYVSIDDMYAKVLFRYSLGRNGWYADWLADEE